jgi:hypothetical protein
MSSIVTILLLDGADDCPSQFTTLNTNIRNTRTTNANGKNILTLDMLLSRIIALFASISASLS